MKNSHDRHSDATNDSQRLSRSEADQLLGEVAEEFFSRLLSGESPSVEEYAVRYPQIAPLIRDTFAAAQLIEHSAAGSSAVDSKHGGHHQNIGDFRIIREIGRGGMGVVYEAEQMSLGRSVALKVLPYAAMMDQRAIIRFKNEARAAATLDHPHIVPVFGVGNDRGIYYYAMSLIQGVTLADVIADLRRSITNCEQAESRFALEDFVDPQERSDETGGVSHLDPTLESGHPTVPDGDPRLSGGDSTHRDVAAAISTHRRRFDRSFFHSVARLGVQAAEALEHAHQHGIVHRDIKPGNVMLDTDSKLWITDFGLARIESDAGVTMTGDLVGTLRYMAPEQALARRVVVDHRADLYALGATLYELLSFRPAFDGADRESLLHQVAFEEAKPLRSLNPSVPRDLHVIIHKTLSKDPDERYQSAKELGDDLSAYLDDEPIRAKPLSLVQRVGRWAGKRKTLVGSVAALLVIAVIGLFVSNTMIAQERNVAQNERDEANRLREEAVRQKQLADSNANRARETVDKYLTAVSGQVLLNKPSMEPLRRELLELALEFYKDFVRDQQDDPELQVELADAYERISRTAYRMGALEDSLEAGVQAITIYRELLSRDPANPIYPSRLAYLQNAQGQRLSLKGANDEANTFYGEALAILEPLVRLHPQDHEARLFLAHTYDNLALAASDLQRDKRIELRQKSIQHLEQLVLEYPHNGMFKAHLALAYINIPRPNDAKLREEQSRSAVTIAEELVGQFPGGLDYQWVLGLTYSSLGLATLQSQHFGEAVEWIQKAIDIQERLASANPTVWKYHQALSESLFDLSKAHQGADHLDGSIAAAKNAIDVKEQFLERNPELVDKGLGLSRFFNQLFVVLGKMGNTDEQTRYLKKWEQLVPASKRDRADWGILGRSYYRLERYAEARHAIEKCLELRGETRPMVKEGPRWWYMAMLLARAGEIEKAQTLYDQLAEQLKSSPQSLQAKQESLRVELADLLHVEEFTQVAHEPVYEHDRGP